MVSVEQSFHQLFAVLEVPPARVRLASERCDGVRDLLAKEGVNVGEIFWGGSFRRGTCVNRLKTVKAHFVLEAKHFYDSRKSSAKLLSFLRNKLAGEQKSALTGRDGQVVTVHYETPPDLELVPSIKLAAGGYLVPNGAGGWFKTNPARQAALYHEKEKNSGGKFQNLTKILKVWNARSGNVFNPYYLELIVYYRVNDYNRTYAELVNSLFWSMLLFLPEFVSCPAAGEIVSRGSVGEAGEKVKSAHEVTARAIKGRDAGETLLLWRSLLGESFGRAGEPDWT
ncbi:MAG: hypothetical protein K6T80_01370 [Firmicutes bacterium]|nr:hypothetical protein [Bacillota bacterium]